MQKRQLLVKKSNLCEQQLRFVLTALKDLLADENLFDPGPQEVEWCKCGYPAARILSDGTHEPMTEMLGFEPSSSNTITYYCPSCDAKRITVAG